MPCGVSLPIDSSCKKEHRADSGALDCGGEVAASSWGRSIATSLLLSCPVSAGFPVHTEHVAPPVAPA